MGIPVVHLGLITADGRASIRNKHGEVVAVEAVWDDAGDGLGNSGNVIGVVDPRVPGSAAKLGEMIKKKASQVDMPIDRRVLVIFDH